MQLVFPLSPFLVVVHRVAWYQNKTKISITQLLREPGKKWATKISIKGYTYTGQTKPKTLIIAARTCGHCIVPVTWTKHQEKTGSDSAQ